MQHFSFPLFVSLDGESLVRLFFFSRHSVRICSYNQMMTKNCWRMPFPMTLRWMIKTQFDSDDWFLLSVTVKIKIVFKQGKINQIKTNWKLKQENLTNAIDDASNYIDIHHALTSEENLHRCFDPKISFPNTFEYHLSKSIGRCSKRFRSMTGTHFPPQIGTGAGTGTGTGAATGTGTGAGTGTGTPTGTPTGRVTPTPIPTPRPMPGYPNPPNPPIPPNPPNPPKPPYEAAAGPSRTPRRKARSARLSLPKRTTRNLGQ